MDDYVTPPGQVDPEVRAYVYSLVNALGGTGADEEGRYVLGDDALACLKDIKRWLKLFDKKTSSLDVARCLAEANLVKGDLLEILAAWPEDATEDKLKSKIALACLELLVPLTWPLDRGELNMNANYHLHVPYLQLKQIFYKREILEHATSQILHTAIRVALPAIAKPIGERAQRDEGIIKLVLFFLRNVVMIEAPADLPVEWNENEVSRSATIEAFQAQDVLALLLTMASNAGEDFNSQDVLVLEILFHLVKGVEVEKLFLSEEEVNAKSSVDLRGLMGKEADMLRNYSKNAPTRHNRFGTMIWIKRDDERVSAVSGQDVLDDNPNALTKMDQSKKWNRPQRRKKEERSLNHFDLPISLTKNARKHLQSFAEDFLDSGFNPLFNHLRRAIEREADRVLEAHKQQYFYVISWFLHAERIRQSRQKSRKAGTAEAAQTASGDFGIVASVLNQETFVLINRFMENCKDHKLWHELNAAMRCFTQILLTIQDMTESKQEVDQEIADNIQNRIFYEESTHDRIVMILREYKDQGFNYLDACTELSHVFLRMLERYSKENLDLQIRSKRRAKGKRKEQQPTEGQAEQDDQSSEAEEIAEAHKVSRERKFDFKRFAAKFMSQGCVDSFVKLTAFFKDLSNEQLKRAHRFFYRLAFKQEMSVVLFRMDILALFHRMVQGPNRISSSSPMFPEWEEFVKQLFRRLVKKLDTRPELFVELLFSKIPATAFFLEHGHEKQRISSHPRPPAELEVKGAFTREEQLGVAVAVLHENHMDWISFVKASLEKVAAERRSWQDEAAARVMEVDGQNGESAPSAAPIHGDTIIHAPNEETRIAMFKDNKLRLLMILAGIEPREGNDDHEARNMPWLVPSRVEAETLRETAAIIEKHRLDPVLQYGDDDPIPAEEMLQRKSQPKARRAEFDDDSGIDDDGFDEEQLLFPAGGPTARKSTALEELKKRRKQKHSREELDDETLAARRKARKMADLEKRRKIKSDVFVHDSDEEDDEVRDQDFFRSERELQERHAAKVLNLMHSESAKEILDKKRKREANGEAPRKRVRSSDDDRSEDSALDILEEDSGTDDKRPIEGASSPSMQGLRGLGLGTSEDDDSDTPMSSPAARDDSRRLAPPSEQADEIEAAAPDREFDEGGTDPEEASEFRPPFDQPSLKAAGGGLDDAEDDEEDVHIRGRSGRERRRAAILDDSDDE